MWVRSLNTVVYSTLLFMPTFSEVRMNDTPNINTPSQPKSKKLSEFSMEVQFTHFEIIILENVSNTDPVYYNLGLQNQVSVVNDTSRIYETIISVCSNNSEQYKELLIYAFPHTLKEFFTVLNEVARYFTTKSIENRRYSSNTHSRIFIYFPTNSTEDYPTFFDNFLCYWLNFQSSGLTLTTDYYSILQNEEVYVMTMTHSNVTTFGDINRIEKFWETVEIYSVNEKFVCQSVLSSRGDDMWLPQSLSTSLIGLATRRSNFHGTSLRIVADEWNEYTELLVSKILDNGTVEFVNGSCVSILRDLEFMLHFKSQNALTHMLEGGNMSSGDTVTFEAQNLDLFITVCAFHTYLMPFYDFLPSLVTSELHAFFRQPTGSVHNIFLLPFTRMVWISFAITWTIIFVSILYLNSRCENSLWFEGFGDTFMSVLGVMTARGWRSEIFEKDRLRLSILTAVVTSFLIVTFYTAEFVASISAPILPIQKYQDFEKYNFKTFLNPGDSGYSLEFAETEADKAALLERSRKIFRDDKDAVEKVMAEDSKFVFLVEIDGFYSYGRYYNLSENELCKVSSIRRPSAEKGVTWKNAMITRKHSPYTEIFRFSITKLIERGLNSRYWTEYYHQTLLHCLPQDSRDVRKELNLRQCLPAFQFLTASFVIALIAIIVEKKLSQKSSLEPFSRNTPHRVIIFVE